jgi:hypothetical protein
MISYDNAVFVLLVSFGLLLTSSTAVFIWLCDKAETDVDSFVLFMILLISGAGSLGITHLLVATPTPTERLEKELSDSNMSLDNMVFVNEGKIFKYNGHWYILTTDSKIIGLSQNDAEQVLE